VGRALHGKWLQFYGELFVRFRDYYTIVEQPGEPVCGCRAQEPGMSAQVQDRIVRETGDRYRVLAGAGGPGPGHLGGPWEVAFGEQSGVGLLPRPAPLDLPNEAESLAE
jgi:hypothetical protein